MSNTTRTKQALELDLDLVRRTAGGSGRPLVFGRGQNPINFGAVTAVAHTVVDAALDPSQRTVTVAVTGPRNLTLTLTLNGPPWHNKNWAPPPRHPGTSPAPRCTS